MVTPTDLALQVVTWPMMSGLSRPLCFVVLCGVVRAYSPTRTLPGAAARRGSRCLGVRAATFAADSEDPKRSRSAEVLDEAKAEEEQAFLEAMDAAAAKARSPEALEALRAAGVSTATALKAAVDADEGHPVAKALSSAGKQSGKVFKALKKPKGTLAVVGEGVGIDTVTMGGYDLNDPTYLSGQYRDGGCAAVLVRDMGYPDGLSADALTATANEQETARGEFPSPLPTISRAPLVDEIQVAAAKAAGAMAVVLPLNLNGAERTKELMDEAARLGLETLVRVTTADELTAACALETTMLVIGDANLEQAEQMLSDVPSGTLSILDIPFADVRGAWRVRDLGFSGLVSGASLLEVCVRDRVPPTAIIKAILSKGSVKYGLGMQKGRLEGSKEFLGSLSM